MNLSKSISFIIPAFNAENTIEICLSKILLESQKFDSEIIVIDDCSTDNTTGIVDKFESVKLFKLKKNRGVGYARNVGCRLAKNNILCYIDSDLVISTNSVLNLVNTLISDKNNGSVGAIPIGTTLNKNSWSSKFVGLVSSFGFDDVLEKTVTTDAQSEFFVIYKDFLRKIGGWRYYRNAGGEEFELGDRITYHCKKNLKIKSATYETYWADLYTKFKKNIDRTEKYIHILFQRQKEKKISFDSIGSSATLNDAISALITGFITINLIILIFIKSISFFLLLIILFLIQFYLEFKFLLIAKKKYGFKMFFYSIYGIQIWNLGIVFGGIYFCINLIKRIFKNKFNIKV